MVSLRPGLVVLSALLAGCVTEVIGSNQASHQERAQAHLNVAQGYLQLGDYSNAKNAIDRVLEVDRRSAQAYGLLALVQVKQGVFKAAESNFRKSLRLNSRSTQLRNNYGVFLFSRAHYKQACQILHQVSLDFEYPARASVNENLGFCWLKLGQIKRAQAAFLQAVKFNPGRLMAWLELTRIEYYQGDCQLARHYYNQFIALGGENDELSDRIVQICQMEPA